MAESGGFNFDLGKKVGGIPLGVWAAVVFGALVIGIWQSKRQSKSADAETAAPTLSPGFGRIPGPDGATSGGDNQPTGDTDNQAWLRRAVAGLIAAGWEPQLVDTALRRYLSGEPLTDRKSVV